MANMVCLELECAVPGLQSKGFSKQHSGGFLYMRLVGGCFPRKTAGSPLK